MGLFETILEVAIVALTGAFCAWLGRTVLALVTLPRRAVRAPACEVCRAAVAGAAELRCPGCGGDLRVTGIITREMEARRRGTLAGALVALVALWVVLYFSVGRFLAAWLCGRSWDDLGRVSEVSTLAGWSMVGVGVAIAIMRRRRWLVGGDREGGRGQKGHVAGALVAWLLAWIGVGGLVGMPLAAGLMRLPLVQANEPWLEMGGGAFGLIWILAGLLVGWVIFRRRRPFGVAAGDNAGP